MRSTILLVAFLLTAPALPAQGVGKEAECEKIKLRIKAIRSKMRSGYSASEGERLKEEHRRLRARRSKVCR